MGEDVLIFCDIEIVNITILSIQLTKKILDIDKVMISNLISFSEKGLKYKDRVKVRPLWIILSKLSGYAKHFDETKYVFFL